MKNIMFLFFTTLLFISSTMVVVVTGNHHHHNDKSQQQQLRKMQGLIVGGWNDIDIADIHNGDEYERLLASADFVYNHFDTTNSEYSLTGTDAMDYTFVSNNDIDVVDGYNILQASKQVVAGMNYRMTIMLTSSGDDDTTTDTTCVGAFDVTVWDQFGDLSIKDWEDEVSCDDANELVLQLLGDDATTTKTTDDTTTGDDVTTAPTTDYLMIVGGWSDINIADIDNNGDGEQQYERLLASAEFVYSHFTSTNSEYTLTGTDAMDYTFVNNNNNDIDDDITGYNILQASQQVVAGMNYRMIIMLTSDDTTTDTTATSCVGAFGVTVWDQFGDLSITDWADELSCDDANELVNADDDTTTTEIVVTVFSSNNEEDDDNSNSSSSSSALFSSSFLLLLTMLSPLLVAF